MVKKALVLVASLCITITTAVTAFASPPFGYNRIIIGDTNNDFVIDSVDLYILHGAVLGTLSLTNEQKVAADVNGDNALTPTDESLLKNYIMSYPGDIGATGTYYYVTYGDVEIDGDITIGDYYFLQSYVNGQSGMSFKQLSAADVNRDGTINGTDVSALGDYLGL
jgi:hypothetical protein